MEKPNFDEAVKMIAGQGAVYKPDGYHFLREALDHTVNQLRKDELIEHRHVSGPELLTGIIEYALKEFGSMAVAVLESWGIATGEDIGTMVFQLIEVGAFGRSEDDSPSDFSGVVNLRDELLAPYRPSGTISLTSMPDEGNEPPARGNQPAKPSEL
ncbi:MAG: hypothetical protein MI807_05305 [Verrucomicrobiales bacterium]|nr:hypothetical protein [Verrucomicrobiales bacterium]